jgi:iron(III) transport system permease protein
VSAPGAVAEGLAAPVAREAWRFDAKWLVVGAAVLAVLWLALVPLGFLVWQSFHTPGTMAEPARFTLENFAEAYGSPETAELFANSLAFALGTACFSLTLGTFFAWVNERTNTPLKGLFFAMSVIPLVIPSILFTVSWILLASPRIGLLNLAAASWFGAGSHWFDIYTIWGMMWVDGLHYSPIAFLLMTAAFRSMDPALEESAMMSGASVAQVAARVTLPLAWPAVLAAFLILFIRAVESFETPALLGTPANIQVFTSAIYDALQQWPSRIGLASAYAVTLLLIVSVGIWLQSRLSSQGNRFATVTGKGFRPRTMDLGRWRYLTAGAFILYVVVGFVLPFLVLGWSSLQRFYALPSAEALATLSFDAYARVVAYPQFWRSVGNSALLALLAATLVMLITSVICWIVVKTKLPGRWLLDNIATLPLVFPGLVLGLAIMICYLTIGGGIYGTIWILLIAYATKFMPYGMRYNTTSMLQIHKELEESAAMSGAGWLVTFRRIILPLLKPGMVAGFIYVMIVSVRELSSSILLYSPGSEVISIIIWELWQNGQYVDLSAFGVMLIGALLVFVLFAQWVSARFGVKEA